MKVFDLMGDCDYSYGSAVSATTSLSSVGHDSYTQSSQPSVESSLETQIESSVDNIDANCGQYYSNRSSIESSSESSTETTPQTKSNGLPLESKDSVSDHNLSAILPQNDEFMSSEVSAEVKRLSQTNCITRLDGNNGSESPKMQNLDELTRRLSKSSQPQTKSETETNDNSIESQIIGSNGSAGNTSANGISGSDNCHLNTSSLVSSESSAVISNPITSSEQQFWSTNCVTESEATQQSFLSGNTSGNAHNGGLPYPQYTSNMNNSFGVTRALSPQSSSSAQRRAITGAHNFAQNSLTSSRTPPQSQSSSLFKAYTSAGNWTAPPQQTSTTSWSSAVSQSSANSVNPWGSLNMSSQKRGVTAVPNMSPISPMKKSPPAMSQTNPSMMISPSKYRRNPNPQSMPMANKFANSMASGGTPFDMVSTGSDTTSSSSDSPNVRDARESALGHPFQVLISQFIIFR